MINCLLFGWFQLQKNVCLCILQEYSRNIWQTLESYHIRNEAVRETNYKNKITMKSHSQQSQNFAPSVVGVDLGSHFTKIAAVNKGTVDVITNEANLRQTPTVVGYGAKERMIGEAGHSKMKSNLGNTIVAPHRYLGFSQSAYVQDESKYASCHPKFSKESIFFKVQNQGKEQTFTAEQVTASFLTKIDKTVSLNQLNNQYLVVAVPDYLTHNERQAVLDSIRIARDGQDKKYGYSLINESTAVGIDYGFYKMNELAEKEEEAKTVLFIDFGHSKLSLYAIKFTKKYQKVVFQKHIRQMGCKSLDQLMFQFYLELFQKANPDLEISVRESKKAVLKLFENIEKQRKVLTGISEYDFSIDCLLQDHDFSYNMSRQQFQEISRPALQQISGFFQSAKETMAKLGVDCSQIQLLGGGSRIPIFIRTVGEVFSKEPSRTLNSSQCIARGAALSAAMQSSIFRVKQYLSFDVCSSGLVCSWKGEGEEIENEACQTTIIQPNELILGEKHIQFSLKPTQEKMLFDIKTLNNTAGVPSQIAAFELLFSEKSEDEVKLKFIVSFDQNKMFSKIAAFRMGEKEEPLPLGGFTFFKKIQREAMEQMIKKEKAYLKKDAQIVESYQLRNNFESQLYGWKGELQRVSGNEKTKDFIDPSSYNQTFSYLAQLQDKLEDIEDFPRELAQVEGVMKHFFNKIEQSQNKYNKVRDELQKLEHFIESMMAGKIEAIRFYPGQEVEKVTQWIQSIKQTLQKGPKYNQLPTTIEEINNIGEDLRQKIDECQAQAKRKEREAQQQYYHPSGPRYNLRNRRNNNDFDPFRTSYGGGYDYPRGRGRSGYNSYGNGFFPGFSGFF